MNINIALIIFQVIGYGLYYLLNIVVANNLDHRLYGDFALASQTMIFGSLLLLFGLLETTIKFFPKIKNKGQYLVWCLRFFILYTIGYLIILVITCSFLLIIKYFHLAPELSIHFVVYIFWLIPIVALFILLNTYLAVKNNLKTSSVLENILVPLLLIILIKSLIIFKYDLQLLSLFIIFFIVYFVLIIVEFIIYQTKYYRQDRSFIKAYKSQKLHNQKTWSKFSINMGFINIPYFLSQLAGLSIVEIFHPSEYSVAYYGAILAILQILIIIPLGTTNLVGNTIAQEKNKQKTQNILRKNYLIVSLISVIITAIIIIFSKNLLAHFSENFIVAQKPLIVLSIFYCLNNIFYNGTVVVQYTPYQKIMIYLDTITCIILIIATSLATIYFGILGTTIAVGTIIFLQKLIYTVLIRKKLQLQTSIII